ncbi:hypothetical protein PAXINDRAFT_172431 [Paxillus involutus ATCC 200175]|uniref:RBR-type E3 ubiquitin transferase n=1 Tax=Paxillus involutus ATCC 200175 TaxID=664439 RepID=A0A0C9TFG5_PAXIN|nr:hypothetical protein PAXINDRAFT_172431 [Paxillus involutus ATCC 200175]
MSEQSVIESNQSDPANWFFSDILKGNERIVSFANVVINREKDTTAGVLAVLNFTRVVFGLEQSSPLLSAIIGSLHTENTIEKSLAICHEWPDNLHMKVEAVYRIPLFERSLKRVSTKYSKPTPDWFTTVLEDLKTANSSAAIILTRYPEVVACLRLCNVAGPDVFVIFNPRPAADQPQEASLTFNTSLAQTVQRLCSILPEKHNPTQGVSNWRALPLGNCYGHVFVPRATSHDAKALQGSLIMSSLAALELQAELSDLQRENRTLTTQNQLLENSVIKLEELREENIKARARSCKPIVKKTSQDIGTVTWSTNPYPKLASPSTGKTPWRAVGDSPISRRTSIAREINTDLGFPRHSSTGKNPWRASTSRRLDVDLDFARRLQATFNAEDTELQDQMEQLLRTAQRRYHCGICLDDFPEDDAVRIESCGHDICRDCVRGHVSTKIDERRFPVLCPVCMADHTNPNPGTICGQLVELLGVSEEQYKTWEEMEMAQFSVLVNCRKCQNSAFVDRNDLEATDEVRCPVVGCDHVWCRKCQQSIDPRGSIDSTGSSTAPSGSSTDPSGSSTDPTGPRHSCDGASELEHLMKEQGWKYCPNCKTPVQKQDGCNHIICISPGCNTQFCYRCGVMITRTVIPQEIGAGKTEHFRVCNLWN